MDWLSPEKLEPVLKLMERFGWPIVALAALCWVILKAGRAIAAGLCYAWERVEPYVTGILSSHSDLMDTTRDQLPKQTAILHQLAEGHTDLRKGQKSHEDILRSIRDSVNRITPVHPAATNHPREVPTEDLPHLPSPSDQ